MLKLWMGHCTACDSWNTYVEEIVEVNQKANLLDKQLRSQKSKIKPVALQSIQKSAEKRLITPDQEFNRTLGGGIVSGSLILIGGQPGIGKSTLTMQLALQIKNKVLYRFYSNLISLYPGVYSWQCDPGA